MTETTAKSAARLLAETRRLLRLTPAATLPEALHPGQLAELMVGCRRTDDRKKVDGELALIAEGIRDKLLAVVEKSKTTTPKPRKIGFVESWKHQHYGLDPNMEWQPPDETTSWQVIDRPAVVAWLAAIEESPPEHVRAWLGPAWQEEAPKVVAGKTAPAADSRPGERRDYFRSLWLELDKPARNDGIWKAIRSRAGKNECPVTSTTGNEEFVFQYSDGGTDRLDKSIFQKDMSAVRAAERKG